MIKTSINFKSVHMHYIKKDKMGVASFRSFEFVKTSCSIVILMSFCFHTGHEMYINNRKIKPVQWATKVVILEI